jgi:DNA end-binding protein Ku
MPRAIWKGSISFGLVNVPVGLYSATESKVVHFHQFDEKTGKRIHNKRVAEGSDRAIDYDDIVKGYEVSKGKYVMITPEELESVEPGPSRTIDIEDFIDLGEVDPVHFDKSYYLAPESGRGADKAYALLREAMTKSGKVAIARFVMRTKQYLGCIRPTGKVLVLETMFFPDEVRDPGDIEDVPGKVKLEPRELKAAQQLVESLSSRWDPKRYHDTYRERVLDLVKAKQKGREIVVEEREEERTDVADLMAALEASIREGRRQRAGGKLKTRAPSKKSSKKTSAGGGTLTKLAKDELVKRAAKADISGRSKMSKDELVDALKKAS